MCPKGSRRKQTQKYTKNILHIKANDCKGKSMSIKSNQIKFYLYSTFLNDFWSSQSAVHIIKIPYSKDTLQQIQQHSL